MTDKIGIEIDVRDVPNLRAALLKTSRELDKEYGGYDYSKIQAEMSAIERLLNAIDAAEGEERAKAPKISGWIKVSSGKVYHIFLNGRDSSYIESICGDIHTKEEWDKTYSLVWGALPPIGERMCKKCWGKWISNDK